MIETYKDLYLAISKLDEGQLEQPVQLAEIGGSNDVILLQPIISIGTIRELFETDGEGNPIEGDPVKIIGYSTRETTVESVVLIGDTNGAEDDFD